MLAAILDAMQGATLMVVLLSGTSKLPSGQDDFVSYLSGGQAHFLPYYYAIQYYMLFEVADKSMSHPDKYKFRAACPTDKSSKSLMSCPAMTM